MEKKIIVDSDGVIRDFVGACEKRYNRKFDWSGQRDVREHLGFTDLQWKEELENFKFWAEMKPTKEAKPLLDLLKSLFRLDQIYIVTSAQQTPCAISGCAAWYKKYLPRFQDRIIYCKDKHLLANLNTILIDDFQKICSSFMRAGGWALLFPRPWNNLSGVANPLQKVKIELELILKINKEPKDAEEGILTLSS